MLKEIGTKTIETDRLILRKFTLSDVDGMYNNWATDIETCRILYWNVHDNKEVTQSIVSDWINKYNNPFYYNWVIELKETNEIIGNISSVNNIPVDMVCEVGYCLGSKYWNKGYGTECLRAVIEFLLNEVGFRLIEAQCISDNHASGRIMEKAGMKKDAVLRSRRINKDTKNVSDTIIYSIMKEEL